MENYCCVLRATSRQAEISQRRHSSSEKNVSRFSTSQNNLQAANERETWPGAKPSQNSFILGWLVRGMCFCFQRKTRTSTLGCHIPAFCFYRIDYRYVIIKMWKSMSDSILLLMLVVKKTKTEQCRSYGGRCQGVVIQISTCSHLFSQRTSPSTQHSQVHHKRFSAPQKC